MYENDTIILNLIRMGWNMNIDKVLVQDLSFQLRKDGLIYDFSRRELIASSDRGILELIAKVEEISNNRCYVLILIRHERFEKLVDDIDLRHFRHLIEETYDSNIEQLIICDNKAEINKVKDLIEIVEGEFEKENANIIDFMRYRDGLR